MAKFLKYIVIVLAILAYGALVYFVYVYSIKPKSAPVTTDVATQASTLTGQVLLGTDEQLSLQYCAKEYYLVSGGEQTRLLGAGATIPGGLSKYKHAEVDVVGTYEKANESCDPTRVNCGCTDTIRVDEIRVIKEGKMFAEAYEGEVTCVAQGKSEEGAWCVHGLNVGGKTYLMVPLRIPGTGSFDDFIGQKVRVLGVTNGSAIDVFEIRRE